MATPHTTANETQQSDSSSQTIKRRGLFAAAVALIGAVVAKVTEQPVQAGVDGDVVLGASNTTTASPMARMTASSSAARVRSDCASRRSLAWASTRSEMSRTNEMTRIPSGSIGIRWSTTSTGMRTHWV